jgi:MFS family permease
MQGAEAGGVRGLLGAPAVGRLWLAGIGAGVMRWLEMLAYSLWVYAETRSPLAVTLTAFARMLPLLLLGAVAGALAERFDRRRLLCGWYVVLAAGSVVLALLAARGTLSVPIVVGFALITGVFWAFETPLRRTMLAEAAGMGRVNASMGLEMTTNQVTRLAGPLIGGWLVGASGIMGVFALGAALYGAGAALLFGLPGAAKQASGASHRNMLADLRDGFLFVRREPLVLAVVVSTALFNLWYMPYVSLAPVVAETTMHLSPGPIGVLVAAEGIGAIAGALWMATLARPQWFALAYALGGTAIAAAALLFALLADPVAGFVILIVGGIGVACFSTMQTTLMLVAAPADKRVRVMGLMMVAIGTAPVGFLLAGSLAELAGPRRALELIAAFGVLSMLACMFIWPELRRLKAPHANK